MPLYRMVEGLVDHGPLLLKRFQSNSTESDEFDFIGEHPSLYHFLVFGFSKTIRSPLDSLWSIQFQFRDQECLYEQCCVNQAKVEVCEASLADTDILTVIARLENITLPPYPNAYTQKTSQRGTTCFIAS
jgi:hypothetical protein